MFRTLLTLALPLSVVVLTITWGHEPALALAVAGGLFLHFWQRRALASAVGPRLDPTSGRPLPAAPWSPWADPVDELRKVAAGWNELGHRASFERVQGNLRLLALSELWRAVSSEEPEAALFDGVRDFCHREAGLVEVALLRLEPRARELWGSWSQQAPDGQRRTHTVRWAVSNIEGSVARALRSAATVAVEDGTADFLLRVNGERPRVATREGAHLVLPLLTPAPRPECIELGWLYREGCPALRPHPDALTRASTREHPRGVDLGTCGSCAYFPVHGVLIGILPEGAVPPDPSTISLLETVATTAASILEHTALYREIKGAERFRDQVLDAMMNGLVSTDQHGRILYANQRAREILADDALLGRRLDECVVLPGNSSAMTRTLIEGKAYLQADATALARSGEGHAVRVPVRVNLTPFRPEEGGVNGAVCLMEDRTTVRAMEQEIRHLDTLAAIGRFASSLAHEVRNPLGGIQAGIEYLERRLVRDQRMDAETQENLEVIAGEIQRLDGILRNLLSVARPREIVLSECDPGALVRRAARSFSTLAESLGIELRVGVASGLDPLHADADMIHQVLVNLLKNALEASSPGSAVDLVVGARRDPTGEDEIDGLVIEVLDRGSGIPEDDLNRIFEPFFSRKSNGTGLGLYVCHGFVQRHDGRLWAENRKGGGSRFVLELPRVPALMGVLHETSHSGRR